MANVHRFSFLDLKEYNDVTDDDEKMVNGTHDSVDYDSGADTDSSGELLERIPPITTDVKIAQRMSKDQ